MKGRLIVRTAEVMAGRINRTKVNFSFVLHVGTPYVIVAAKIGKNVHVKQ